MKLSIVVPVYNVRDYLRACVDSVDAAIRRAGCGGETELVVVDDGSSDGSAELCDELGRERSWMRVFHRRNQGVAAARNFALGEVSGEYLTWIDPDDLVEPAYFVEIFNALGKNPDAVLFDYSYMPGGPRHYRGKSCALPIETVWRDLVRDERLKSFLCCKVVRRELVPAPLFDETCAIMSDFEAMGRLFGRVKSVEYVHSPLYVYRRRVGSIVNQPVPGRMMTMFRLALKRMDEVGPDCHADAVSCAMYHAYHYCHMAAKFPSPAWKEEGRLSECRGYVRRNLFKALADPRNGMGRKLQFLLVSFGLMKAAVAVRRWLPGGRAS